MTTSTDISDLYNTKKGVVNILGAGPSLFHVDTRILYRHDCIFVNSAALLLPCNSNNFNVWLSLDRLCLKWSYFWKNVIVSDCLKIVNESYSKFHSHISKAKIRYFESRQEVEINNIFDNKLCGISSVPASIDLALKMGYEKILLFGVDHRFIQGKSHFWEFYPKEKRPTFSGGINIGMKEQKIKFDSNISYFEELKRKAEQKGACIINCAKRTSVLNVFQSTNSKEGLLM